LIAGAVLLVVRARRGRARDEEDDRDEDDDGVAPGRPVVGPVSAVLLPSDGWFWPAPILGRDVPEVSDGFHMRRSGVFHRGVDIAYRRRSRTDRLAEYPAGSPNGTPGYFLPDGVPALAARAGRVVKAERTRRGFTLVIDHGGFATYYTHLDRMFVAVDDAVRAGQPLGIIGADPSQGRRAFKHLHFELWPDGTRASAIDPRPRMRVWPWIAFGAPGAPVTIVHP
jgi:murein DD-endopeptidase MepM/ murein hydrolase activator NlpD